MKKALVVIGVVFAAAWVALGIALWRWDDSDMYNHRDNADWRMNPYNGE